MVEGEYSPTELGKFVLVLVGITMVSFVLWGGNGGWLEYLRWFMGVFFITFAGFKLAGYQMFAEMFAGYDVVAKRFKPYAYAYPFIELALGMVYLADLLPVVRDVIALAVMAIGTVGVAQEIRRRSGIHCACLGNIIKLPLSTVSLVEDVGMGVMAAVMLLA